MSGWHFQFPSQRSGIKGSVCNEVWANTASDQIHNWEALNHASRGTCSICMSCLTRIVCAHTYLCACLNSCMNAPATMRLVTCLWQLPCAYYVYIHKPTSPLIPCDTTAELFLSAFWWSITPPVCIQWKDARVCRRFPNAEWRSSLNYCRTSKGESEDWNQR